MQKAGGSAILLCGLDFAVSLEARPYPGASGLVASADSAATAGQNSEGMTRFKTRNMCTRISGIFIENTWESEFENSNVTTKTDDSETIVVPTGYLVQPINEDRVFGFTVLGSGFSEDFGDWPGRYLIEDYDLINISAFPSLAYRVNDQLSLGAGIALTYTSYEQNRAVLNRFDPGFADGNMKLDTDGYTMGFGLSALYEFSAHTRIGLAYQSELDPELDGKAKFDDLGPNTEAAVDVVWADFNNFELPEIYVDGNSISENEANYEDIWAVSASYSWPVSERLMLGVSGLYVDYMIKDNERTLTLRLDSMWSVGMGLEWLWKAERKASDTLLVEIGMSLGSGSP